MKIKQPPACANCKFLHLADNKGECRRYPPQLAGLVTQRVQPKFFARKITSGVSAFPGVAPGQWCGEFEPRVDSGRNVP